MASARSRRGARRLAAAAGKFLAIAVLFAAVVIGSGYVTMRWALLGRQVTVPDVTGMTLPEALASLSAEELFLEALGERHDDRLERGRILAQEPPAGAGIKKGRKVKVVTSLGPRVLRVPDLAGQSQRSAAMRLEGEGLRTGRIAYAHTLVGPADTIVSQDPLPSGESLGEGGVSLLVSRGPRRAIYVMPDLGGRRAADVRDVLESHGLRIGSVRRERAGGRERGAITGQYPEPGYPVGTGDVVSLVVAE